MTNLLWHNPLAEMYGPHFLVFYSVVAMLILLMCARRVRWRETVHDDGDIHRETLDPYEVAYLRGREGEVLRLAALSLVQQGYLEAATRKTRQGSSAIFVETRTHPDPSVLPEIERAVFARLADSGATFSESMGAEVVGPFCRGWHARLQDENLIPRAEQERDARRTRRWAALALATLAVYKVSAAILNGHSNVLFLIILAAAALVAVCVVCSLPRQTAQGKQYLSALSSELSSHSDLRALDAPLSQGALLVLAGVLGMSILKDTAFGSVYEALEFSEQKQSASSGAGGCGGGCGGGGCGGGCGGCGGCGG